MKINYDKIKVIHDIPPVQPKNHYVVFDVELFGAEKHLLHRPTGKFACVSVTVDEKTCYLLTDESQVAPTLENCKDAIWVASNLPFDLRHLRRWSDIKPRKKVYCIETIERILWANWYKDFSVVNTARRYCEIVLDKEPVKDFYDATELNNRLIEYAVTDGIVEYRILQEQLKVLHKNPWAYKTWMEIDMLAMWAYLDFYGFRVDADEWYRMADEAVIRYEETKDSFPFNPNSSKAQVQPWFRKHGAKVTSADIATMEKLSTHKKPEVADMAKRMLEYAKMKKPATTYGRSFIDGYLEEVDGVQVIFPDYNLSRAITGRESSRLHNIPARENPEYRKPWIARPGNKLIVADWSAQEARAHAFYTQDPTLIQIFVEDKDVYTETVNLMYDLQIDKSDPKRNEIGKPSFLGATYGQTKFGLMEKYGLTEEEAEDMQDRFFKVFPGSKAWCDKQRKKNNYVETAMGRRCWLNPYLEGDNERNALNSPHQGLGADMKKKALAAIYFNWNFPCPFGVVHENHDEIVLDVPEELAEEIAQYVEHWMVKVGEDMCPGIPFKADAHIGDSWYDAKG